MISQHLTLNKQHLAPQKYISNLQSSGNSSTRNIVKLFIQKSLCSPLHNEVLYINYTCAPMACLIYIHTFNPLACDPQVLGVYNYTIQTNQAHSTNMTKSMIPSD